MTSFNVQGHVDSRQKRHSQSDIYNSVFPGLATVELNITELCNRTCSFCPRYDPEVYPNQKLFMALETVEKLTDQLRAAQWYGDIHITGFGEPHTHPQLAEIVEILSNYANLYVEITTNGDRLIDMDLDYTIGMFEHGLNLLTVDCYDGEEQYETRKQIMESRLPKGLWRLRYHHDTGNAQELIEQYGFNNRSGVMGGTGVQGQCYLPFYKAFIDWDGEVRLCCNDWHRKAGPMGNVLKEGFAESWNGPQLTKIREFLSRGERGGACADCNINGKKFGKESYDFLMSTS